MTFALRLAAIRKKWENVPQKSEFEAIKAERDELLNRIDGIQAELATSCGKIDSAKAIAQSILAIYDNLGVIGKSSITRLLPDLDSKLNELRKSYD